MDLLTGIKAINEVALAVAAAMAAAALWILATAVARLRRRRLLSAGGRTLGGASLLTASTLALLLAANLQTYHRLTHEIPTAELSFEQTGPQQFAARLTTRDGEPRTFVLYGDQWQLDARMLKWRGWANLMGLDTWYRLERLSGRYAAVEQEMTGNRSVYALSTDPGIDVWQLAHRYDRWLPVVDTVYGSAAYMPMTDRARYRVSMGPSGLVARPADNYTRNLLRDS